MKLALLWSSLRMDRKIISLEFSVTFVRYNEVTTAVELRNIQCHLDITSKISEINNCMDWFSIEISHLKINCIDSV